MLSYRHAFHAGNHADVLKHIILIECLQYMTKKDTPLLYADTHAGAGVFNLETGYANQNKEWNNGITKLIEYSKRNEAPQPVLNYIQYVNKNFPLYYGSPMIAKQLLRKNDRLALFELHPSDYEILQTNFSSDKRCQINKKNGFTNLKAYLPPVSHRAFVLIDPSYELSSDYTFVVDTIEDSLKRFATGVYAVWYPLLNKKEPEDLQEELCNIAPKEKYINITLEVNKKPDNEYGMYGSGMFVINPPWALINSVNNTLQYLKQALSEK